MTTGEGTAGGAAVALPERCDADALRPRRLRTLARLLRAHLAARPDDLEAAARLADVDARIAALDAEHAAWFAEIPGHLLMKVNGSPDRKPFQQVGESVTRLLKEEMSALREAGTILDFGVGLSRVMWPMMQEFPDARFIGFDVDPMMLAHTEKLGLVADARIVHSTQPIADGSIDATYVISVFTHLMTTVDFWLGEIHRILSGRGQALITYHDETLYADLRAKGHVPRNTPPECRERVLVGAGSEGSTRLAVFYETPCWEERLSHFFVVEKTVPRGLHGNQSYSVVRRRDVAVDRDRLRLEYLCSLEEELYRLRLAKKLMF
jgi:hypothetical protein